MNHVKKEIEIKMKQLNWLKDLKERKIDKKESTALRLPNEWIQFVLDEDIDNAIDSLNNEILARNKNYGDDVNDYTKIDLERIINGYNETLISRKKVIERQIPLGTKNSRISIVAEMFAFQYDLIRIQHYEEMSKKLESK